MPHYDWASAPARRGIATLPANPGSTQPSSAGHAQRDSPPAPGLHLTGGEAPLWLVVIAGALLVAAPQWLLGGLLALLDLLEHPRLAAFLVLAGPVLYVGLGWCWLRAVRRAASRPVPTGRRSGVRGATVLLAVVGQGLLVAYVLLDAQFMVRSLVDPMLGRTPLPTITLHDGGARLRLAGAFELGAKRALRKALDANPGVRMVELHSPGGLAVEGLAIGRLIESRGLDTFAPRHCHSACLMAFAGGTGRYITAATLMGMHSAGGPGATQDEIDHANRMSDGYLLARGVDPRVVEKAAYVPHDHIWVPEPWVLLASGLATDYRLADAPVATRWEARPAPGASRQLPAGPLPPHAATGSRRPREWCSLWGAAAWRATLPTRRP